MAERRFLADLQRFWDAIARGEPATPGDLDPELAATIEQWHALPDVPLPDPAYANQLRERIMHTASMPVFPPIPQPTNGRVPPRTRQALLPSPAQTVARRRLAQELFALLLVAALLMSAAGVFLRNQQGAEQRASAPLLATPTAPASSDWPMYRGGPSRNGATTVSGPDGQPVVLWQYASEGTAWRSPAVAGGVAYLQSGDGKVTALDAATGEVRWQATLESVSDTPTVAGDTLYVNTGSGSLVALNAATGEERWRFGTDVSATTTPLVVAGMLYTGGDDGTVYALDAATGQEQWHVPSGGPISRSLALVDSRLYVPTAAGSIVALDAASGKEQWRVTGENPDDFVGTPAVADGVIYFGLSGKLHAVDAVTGKEQWSIEYAGTPSSVASGMVVSSDPEGVVHGFDAATGDERWTFATSAKVQAAALLTTDTAYVGGLDQTLYALDLATGAERWEFALDGAVDYGPTLAGGVIYVGTDAGTLYALGGSGSSQLTAPLEATTAPVSALAIPTVVTEPTLVHIWTRSREARDFSGILSGLAIDPFSRLWMCNAADGSLDIFDRDGNKLQHIAGGIGSGPGQFDWVIGEPGVGSYAISCDITFAPDGTAYITDADNQRIQMLAPDGTVKGEWSTKDPNMPELQGPVAISQLPNGEFLVTDWGPKGVIRRFSADGTYINIFAPDDDDVQSIFDPFYTEIDPDGSVWVLNWGENRVIKLSPEGKVLLTIGGPLPGSGPGKFREPSSMTLDAQGHILVADDDNQRIQIFDHTGKFLAQFTGSEAGIGAFGEPNGGVGLIVDGGNGYLYVYDYSDASPLKGDERLMKLQLLLPPADLTAAGTPVS